jgi:hypothetical protein
MSRPFEMSNQSKQVWRVYRIEGRKAVVIKALKATDADRALNAVVDDLGITDPKERERFFARLDD